MNIEKKNAYRSSPELGAALIERDKLRREFVDTVVQTATDQAGRETVWVKSPGTVDVTCVGFQDSTEEVPAGLSRTRTREWLIPAKTAAGKRWQEILDRMGKMPGNDEVLRQHGVETMILHGGYVSSPGFFLDREAGVAYLFCLAELHSEHLSEIKQSEFWAAREAVETRQAMSAKDDA